MVGDTVGDPFKDTSGPSLNILIKLCSTVSIVFSGLILAFSLLIKHKDPRHKPKNPPPRAVRSSPACQFPGGADEKKGGTLPLLSGRVVPEYGGEPPAPWGRAAAFPSSSTPRALASTM